MHIFMYLLRHFTLMGRLDALVTSYGPADNNSEP